MRRLRRVTAVTLTLLTGIGGASPLVSQTTLPPSPSASDLIREALNTIDRAQTIRQVEALLTLHTALAPRDQVRADALLHDAATRAQRLTEGDSIATMVLKGVFAGVIWGVASAFAGLPWWAYAASIPETSYRDPDEARAVKGTVSLAVVEALASRDQVAAFRLGSSIDLPYMRGRAFDTTLRARQPVDARILPLVREQIEIARRQQAAAALAGLAHGLAVHDPDTAAESIRYSAELWRNRHGDMRTADSMYVLGIAAEMDRDSAVKALDILSPRQASSRDELIVFAGATARVAPDLAWRALQAGTPPNDTDKSALMRASAVLRELPLPFALEHRDEVRAYSASLVDRASNPRLPAFIFIGPNGDAVVAAINATATLARLAPDAAQAHADRATFHNMVIRSITQRLRIGDARTFPRNLMHLERALVLLESDPAEAAAVLESLERTFWQLLVETAYRERPEGLLLVNNRAIVARTREQLDRVMLEWPAAAVRLKDQDRDLAVRLLRRYTQTAEWLDAEAIEWLADEERAALLSDYLPLALARSAQAWASIDATESSRAVQRASAVARTASSPSREWALAYNAAIWRAIDTGTARKAIAEDATQIGRLRERGVSRDWWPSIPAFLGQVAAFDLAMATQLGRRTDPAIRALALASVAAAISH